MFTSDDYLTTRTVQVNIIAPAWDRVYTLKIFPTEKGGDGGNPRLVDDFGITIRFTVSNPTGCTPAATSLSLMIELSCVVYKTTLTTFTAKLNSGVETLADKTIDFTIEGTDLGSVVTDTDGKVTLTYDPSGLAVGGYTVVVSFQGDECYLEAYPASAPLGVRYDFCASSPR